MKLLRNLLKENLDANMSKNENIFYALRTVGFDVLQILLKNLLCTRYI